MSYSEDLSSALQAGQRMAYKYSKMLPSQRDDLLQEARYHIIEIFNAKYDELGENTIRYAVAVARNRLRSYQPTFRLIKVPSRSYRRNQVLQHYCKIQENDKVCRKQWTTREIIDEVCEDERQRLVLDLLRDHTIVEAAAESGVPYSTIMGWRKKWRRRLNGYSRIFQQES